MHLSDKVIKATNVKLVGKPAGNTGQHNCCDLGEMDDSLPQHELNGFAQAANQRLLGERIADVKKEAYEKGFFDSTESRKKEMAQILSAVAEVTRQTVELKKKLYTDAEEQILKLVISIAEKVIHTEVSTNRDIIINVLREAAKSIVARDGIKIHLNPEDFRYITEIKQDLFQEMSWLKNSAFEEDASIRPGGVLLETVSGEIDARLDQQLNEIKKSLQKR
jgi:flagellar assembly protein FliH